MKRLKGMLSQFLLGLERDFHTFRRSFNYFAMSAPLISCPISATVQRNVFTSKGG